MRSQHTVVIKKAAHRRDDHGEGGGAWKVAFADFTLAMMALFLVLWLLAVTEQQEREQVASTLRNYSILDGGVNPFDLGNNRVMLELADKPSVVEAIAKQLLSSGNKATDKSEQNQQGLDGNVSAFFESKFETATTLDALGKLISEMGRLLNAHDNLAVEVVPQGLRIRLQDNQNRQMFERGGSNLDPFFENLVYAIAPVFNRIENGLIISGHTDSVPFQGSRYSNWELSGDRALMARRALETGGTPQGKILQVVAMSDRTLADPNDPLASSNRRIEILVLTKVAERELMGLFDDNVDSALSKARQSALDKSRASEKPVP
jgi:chemotaxis protein MotB